MVKSPTLGIITASIACFFPCQAGGMAAAQVKAAQSSSAEQTSDSSPDDIIVTALRRKSYQRTLAEVRAITAAHHGQYARFESELCPKVLGVPEQLSPAIEERIRTVAHHVGVRVARQGCAPNFTIFVAGDGPKIIEALQRKFPNVFATMTGAEITRLKRHGGPVWNWYAIDPKRRDGGPVEHMSMVAFGPSDPGRPVSPGAYITSNVTMSRLSESVRLDLTQAFVVISSRVANGLTVKQLADASTLLGLSMIDVGRIGEVRRPTALELLLGGSDSRSEIDGVTAFDIAYLTALYSGDAGYSSDQQTARITIAINRNRAPATSDSEEAPQR